MALRPIRRSRKIAPKIALFLFGLVGAVFALSRFDGTDQASGSNEYRIVQRVIDGDTQLLDNRERVRLIGVDTPETKHPSKPVQYFGKEASAFTKRMVEGKRVRLEFDMANTAGRHKDRYGRTLAYVFLEDGTLLNAEIIKQGYGHAYTAFPFSRMEEFRRLEREAREQGRGLWQAQ
jgi:micrococcal nuclease